MWHHKKNGSISISFTHFGELIQHFGQVSLKSDKSTYVINSFELKRFY